MIDAQIAKEMYFKLCHRVDAICEQLSVDERVRARLQRPYQILTRFVTLKRSDGSEQNFPLIRVQHLNPYTTGAKPYGGGLRYYQYVDWDGKGIVDPNIEIMTWLMQLDAAKMTYKHAAVGPKDHLRVRFGGAKGCLGVDPRKVTKRELMQLTQQVVQRLNSEIGPYDDRVAPDMGTNEVIMDEFMTHYGTLNKGKHIPCEAIATGKSLDNGGCEGRLWATAAGMYDVFNCFRTSDEFRHHFTKPLTAIIIGCGNVGGWFLRFAKEQGISVVGVADIDGTIWRPNGGLENEVDAIFQCIKDKGSIKHYAAGEHLSLPELLAQQCHLLVPAAQEGMITAEVAKNLKARVILEGANNPTLEDAFPVLKANKVLDIPDIIANAGGATVSYFEWQQGIRGSTFTLEEINKFRKEYLEGGVIRTIRYAKKYGTDLHTGALMNSIDFIANRLKHKHHWDD
ncbi:MAG: Glu/Leu/Phe/Val dehydrogenase dimerization domain-containing protein [bacterium]|nr:Glu/Leu/Phe/Val dehydrogenase dimerization domain-containing protein [bacterium]